MANEGYPGGYLWEVWGEPSIKDKGKRQPQHNKTTTPKTTTNAMAGIGGRDPSLVQMWAVKPDDGRPSPSML